MNKKEVKKKIRSLRPWYQSIDLDGVKTKKKAASTIELWNDVKKILPKNLKGMRILDLGANAGHFSIQAALFGAEEVVSIDLSNIWYQQFLFVRDFFEKKYGPLNITYINKNISHVNLKKLGSFDYIFAFAILYHIGKHEYGGKHTKEALGEQIRIIELVTQISNNIFVRYRHGKHSNVEYYDEIFFKFGFKSKVISIDEKRGLSIYNGIS